ncbi:MAG: CHAT domain-containing protein [Bacteroidota bacterium]
MHVFKPFFISVLLLTLSLSFRTFGYSQTDAERADELYDRIMQADGFDEALGYEILGDVYPEYEVLQQADQVYEEALQSDNPEEIARAATQLAQRQYRPIAQMQALILKLKSLPKSDTLNRLLASVLLDYDRMQDEEAVLDGTFFELLGAPDTTQLADPLDWIDPDLALEALLRRYRGPLPKGAPVEDLMNRLDGLQHCLSLLHELRRSRSKETDRLALAATVPPLAHRALVIALQLDRQEPQGHWREQAFLIAEQAKATLLADQLQGYSADREDLSWPKLEQQLRLARQLSTQSGEFFAAPQRLRDLIANQLPELGHWPPRSTATLSVAEIQAQLQVQEQLLISYFLLGQEGVVFHLDGTQLQVDHFYWNQETTDAWRKLRQQLITDQFLSEPTQAHKVYSESALWLYEGLLQRPVLRHYQAAPQKLLLLPDAALWDIPFSALITEAPITSQLSYHSDQMAYLVNQYSLGFAPSVQAWYELGKTESAGLSVAALAPDFGGDAVAVREACASPLPDLPNSSVEVQTITEQVPGEAFIGTDAALRTLQEASHEFTVWHLATHACRDPENPSQSAVFLQDGALTAAQIAQLPLQLQLVVLSACETQSGPYRPGEGVLTIGRAFLQAGAQALIGSLWPVSDAATAELMPLFYEQLAAGASTGEALRTAQLSFLSTQDRLTAHPHYWAGFVLVGPDNTFSSTSNYYIWILGGLLLLGILAIFGRRK